jgi:hypothetical protein
MDVMPRNLFGASPLHTTHAVGIAARHELANRVIARTLVRRVAARTEIVDALVFAGFGAG